MITKYKKTLKKKGILILNNIFSRVELKKVKNKLEKILDKRIKQKKNVGDVGNLAMYNYFYEDPSLLKLILISKVDKILKEVLDKDYVLQSSNAQNRILNHKKLTSKKSFKIGATWHTDSGYLGGKRLDKCFSYIVIIALDSFTKKNGPTLYIENSINFRNKPKRKTKAKSKELLMPEGSVCIMDSGMWHKAGKSTNQNRWSIFSIYTGWFVKPYHNFSSYCKKKNILKKYKRLLHHNSTPPEIDQVRNTVTSK